MSFPPQRHWSASPTFCIYINFKDLNSDI